METLTNELVVVHIETSLGAHYEFPDMPFETVWKLIKNDDLCGFSQISLVNQSGACLVIPTRLIQRILVNGEEHWSRKG